MIFVEQEALEHMSTYLCVEQEALEHMRKKWMCWDKALELSMLMLENKLGSIASLAIVSLGVSYKYILAFSVERKLWNCTMFVTPYYRC